MKKMKSQVYLQQEWLMPLKEEMMMAGKNRTVKENKKNRQPTRSTGKVKEQERHVKNDNVENFAEEVRQMGRWNFDGFDIVPPLLTLLPQWKKTRLGLKIKQGEVIYTLKEGAETLCLNRINDNHYQAILTDGTIKDAPGDGDCFFSSILIAMKQNKYNKEYQLFMGGASGLPTKDQVQVIRGRIANYILEHQYSVQDYLVVNEQNVQTKNWKSDGKKIYLMTLAQQAPEINSHIQNTKPFSEQTFWEKITTLFYVQNVFGRLFRIPEKPPSSSSGRDDFSGEITMTSEAWDIARENSYVDSVSDVHDDLTEEFSEQGLNLSMAILLEYPGWERIDLGNDTISEQPEAQSNPANRAESWWGLPTLTGIATWGYHQVNSFELTNVNDGDRLEQGNSQTSDSNTEVPSSWSTLGIMQGLINLLMSGFNMIGRTIITHKEKGIIVLYTTGAVTVVSSGVYYYGEDAIKFIKKILGFEKEEIKSPAAEQINSSYQTDSTTENNIDATNEYTVTSLQQHNDSLLSVNKDDQKYGDDEYQNDQGQSIAERKRIHVPKGMIQGTISDKDKGYYFTLQSFWRADELNEEVIRLLTKTQLPKILAGNSMVHLLPLVYYNIFSKSGWNIYGTTLVMGRIITADIPEDILTIAETVLIYPAILGGKQTIADLMDLVVKIFEYYGYYTKNKSEMEKRMSVISSKMKSLPEVFTEKEIRTQLASLKKSDKSGVLSFILLISNKINRNLIKVKAEGGSVYNYIIDNARNSTVDDESTLRLEFDSMSRNNKVLSEYMGWTEREEIIAAIVKVLLKYDMNGNKITIRKTPAINKPTTAKPTTISQTTTETATIVLFEDITLLKEVVESIADMQTAEYYSADEIVEYKKFLSREKGLPPDLRENATIWFNDMNAMEQFLKVYDFNQTLMLISAAGEDQEDIKYSSQFIEEEYEDYFSLKDDGMVKRSAPQENTGTISREKFKNSPYNFLTEYPHTNISDADYLNFSAFESLYNIAVNAETHNNEINVINAHAKLASVLLDKMEQSRADATAQEQYYWFSQYATNVIIFMADHLLGLDRVKVKEITRKLKRRFDKINHKSTLERYVPADIFADYKLVDNPESFFNQMPGIHKGFWNIVNFILKRHALDNDRVDLVVFYEVLIIYLYDFINGVMSGSLKIDGRERLEMHKVVLKQSCDFLNNKLYFLDPKGVVDFFDVHKNEINNALDADFSNKKDIDIDDVFDKLYLAMNNKSQEKNLNMGEFNFPTDELQDSLTSETSDYLTNIVKVFYNVDLDIAHHIVDQYIDIYIKEPNRNVQTYFNVTTLNHATPFQLNKKDGTGQTETAALSRILMGDFDLEEYQIVYSSYIPKNIIDAIINSDFKTFAEKEINKNFDGDVSASLTGLLGIHIRQGAMHVFSQQYNANTEDGLIAKEAVSAYFSGKVKPRKVYYLATEASYEKIALPTVVFLPHPEKKDKGVCISLKGDVSYYIVNRKPFIKDKDSYDDSESEQYRLMKDPYKGIPYKDVLSFKKSKVIEGDPVFQQFITPHLSPYDRAYTQLFLPESIGFMEFARPMSAIFDFEEIKNITDFFVREAPENYKKFILDSIRTMQTMGERKYKKRLDYLSGFFSNISMASFAVFIIITGGAAVGVFAAGASAIISLGVAVAGTAAFISDAIITFHKIDNAKTTQEKASLFNSFVFSIVLQILTAKGISKVGQEFRDLLERPAVRKLLRSIFANDRRKLGAIKNKIKKVMGGKDSLPLLEYMELNELGGASVVPVRAFGTTPTLSALTGSIKKMPESFSTKQKMNHLASLHESEVMKVTSWNSQHDRPTTKYALRIFDSSSKKFMIYDPFLMRVNKKYSFLEEDRWIEINQQQGTQHTLVKIQYFSNIDTAMKYPASLDPYEGGVNSEVLRCSDWYSQKASSSIADDAFDESTPLPKGYGITLSNISKKIKTISPIEKSRNFKEVFEFSSADAAFRRLSTEMPVKIMTVVSEGENSIFKVGYILITKIESEEFVIDLQAQSAMSSASWQDALLKNNKLQEKLVFMQEYKDVSGETTNYPGENIYNPLFFNHKEAVLINFPALSRERLIKDSMIKNKEVSLHEREIEKLNIESRNAESAADKKIKNDLIQVIYNSPGYNSLKWQEKVLNSLKQRLGLLLSQDLLYTTEISQQLKLSITTKTNALGEELVFIAQPDEKGIVTDVTGNLYMVTSDHKFAPFRYLSGNKMSGIVLEDYIYFIDNQWETEGEYFSRLDKVLDHDLRFSATPLTPEGLPKAVSPQAGYQYDGIYYSGDMKTAPEAVRYYIVTNDDFYPVEWNEEFDSWKLTKGKKNTKGDWYIKQNEDERWGLNRVTEEDRLSPVSQERRATSGIRMDEVRYYDRNYWVNLRNRKAELERVKNEVNGLSNDEDYVSLSPLTELVIFSEPEKVQVADLASLESYAKNELYENADSVNLYTGLDYHKYPPHMRLVIRQIKHAVYESKHMAKLSIKALSSVNEEDVTRVNDYLKGAYGTSDPNVLASIRNQLTNVFKFIYKSEKEMRKNGYENIVISSVLDENGISPSFVTSKPVLAVSFPLTLDNKMLIPYEINRNGELFKLEDTIGHELSHFKGTEDQFYLGTLPHGLIENAESARVYAQTELIKGLERTRSSGLVSDGDDEAFFRMMEEAYEKQGKVMEPGAEDIAAMPPLKAIYYRGLLVKQLLNDPMLSSSFFINNADHTAMSMRDIAYGRPYDDTIRHVVAPNRERRDINATLNDASTNTTNPHEYSALQMARLFLSFHYAKNATKPH